MCHRCIVGTFVSAAVLGTFLGFGLVGGRYLLSHERAAEGPYRATAHQGYHAMPNPHAVYFVQQTTPRTAVMTPSLPTKISYNFPKARLVDVAHFIGTYTRRTFIAGPGVDMDQEVTFIASTPATIAEAYKAFLKLLSMKGLMLYQQGNKTIIVPNGSVPAQPRPNLPAGSQITTKGAHSAI